MTCINVTKKIAIAITSVFFISGAALAQTKTDIQKCVSSIEIVKEMAENSDSGEKELKEVGVLVEISETLCDGSYFEEAEKLLDVARGIMGTEESADKDDMSDEKK